MNINSASGIQLAWLFTIISASLDQLNPSNYNNGFLVAYQLPDLLINFIWLQSPDTA
ncbi:MAG: hypothetical protein IPL71_16010, partial [Anaerolineales bacterium]|nr:hypothetical protein [Anaerolineales bacterium]